MDVSERARFPLGDFLGMQVSVPAEGEAVAVVDLDERLHNPNGVAHGAVLFAMVDTAMGAATLSVLERGQRCATTDIQLRFLRSVSSGRLEASVVVTHRSRRTTVLEARVHDEDDELIATATGAFAVLDQR